MAANFLPAGCGGGGEAVRPSSVSNEQLAPPNWSLGEDAAVAAPPELDDESRAATPSPLDVKRAYLAVGLARVAPTLEAPEMRAKVRALQAGDSDLAANAGDERLPHNWEIRFARGNTTDVYAAQLDQFGIELGVVQPDGRIVYVRQLSAPEPEVHEGPADEEKRFYFTWRSGDLGQADSELLIRAKVSVEDRVVLKLLPPQLEQRLVDLEREYAGERADRVQKTRFAIRGRAPWFEFYVAEQWYR
ncbi:MAG: hypothetical protein ACOY3P_03155 [Planctomycetota bacterium]